MTTEKNKSLEHAWEELKKAHSHVVAIEEQILSSGSEGEWKSLVGQKISAGLKAKDDASLIELKMASDLISQRPFEDATVLLLDVLSHEHPAVRVEAGEALLELAYERYKEVAQCVEKLLAETSPTQGQLTALEELPFILSEVHDPDPLPLLKKFLVHPHAEVVASALEVISYQGDPEDEHLLSQLQKLTSDKRKVTVPEMDDAEVSLGDLVKEAMAHLSQQHA